MTIQEKYRQAIDAYAAVGADVETALRELRGIPISIHCWQGDDVNGFDGDGELSGGIQTTGNYPGKARTPDELMGDIDKMLGFIAGKHRLNLHASYAIFGDGPRVDRDRIGPEHFSAWVDFAKEKGIALDFNPTLFSHEKAGLFTLANPDPGIRGFWVEHCKRCVRITDYFAEELGGESLMNVWAPDGLKDLPADRRGPRERFAASMDEVLTEPHDPGKVFVSLESKVFGIGLESYTVGSNEFTLSYAASRGILPLFDNGHYHPTEIVSDKIASALLFFDRIALHVTRSVRWDSDHVIRYDDEIRDIAQEIVAAGPGRFFIGTDFFDASINRIAAWTIGVRNLQKALLYALLSPRDSLAKLQDEEKFTELFALQEALKVLPFGDVWNLFCESNDVPDDFAVMESIGAYEREVLSKRED
jgi:L-rhamnose isomerase